MWLTKQHKMADSTTYRLKVDLWTVFGLLDVNSFITDVDWNRETTICRQVNSLCCLGQKKKQKQKTKVRKDPESELVWLHVRCHTVPRHVSSLLHISY